MNEVITTRPKLKEILKVTNSVNFHSFLVNNAIETAISNLGKKKTSLGTILALGASHVEAENLIKFPFDEIVLSGITPADKETEKILKKDKRVSYKLANMENLSFKNTSFDFVFVKEAIHHVPRPYNALYEMFRVARKGVIFIEPNETFLGKILNNLNLSSKYEKNQSGNIKFRDNFVYRWNNEEILKSLNSYYLDSGYKVIFSNCWMSNRYNMHYPNLIRYLNIMGWIASFIPKNSGNYLTCIIYPGKNLPK